MRLKAMRYSVFDNGDEVPDDVWPAVPEPRCEWGDGKYEWKKDAGIGPVYIRKFGPLASVQHSVPKCEVWLFGFRFNFRDAKIEPHRANSGYYVDYCTVIRSNGILDRVLYLGQRRSVEYTHKDCNERALVVSNMKKKEYSTLPRIGSAPVWKKANMGWPITEGRPMVFIGQVTLPENDVTSQYLTCFKSIFVFLAQEDGEYIAKIVTQQADQQTAEEHYALEELVDSYAEIRTNDKSVIALLRKGGIWAEEYILEQDTVTIAVLQYVAEKGANQSIRSAAKKRQSLSNN